MGFGVRATFFFFSNVGLSETGAATGTVDLGLAETAERIPRDPVLLLLLLLAATAATAGISVLSVTEQDATHGAIDAAVAAAVADAAAAAPTGTWCNRGTSLLTAGFFFLITGVGGSIRCSGSLSLDTVASESLDDESMDSYCRI